MDQYRDYKRGEIFKLKSPLCLVLGSWLEMES